MRLRNLISINADTDRGSKIPKIKQTSFENGPLQVLLGERLDPVVKNPWHVIIVHN